MPAWISIVCPLTTTGEDIPLISRIAFPDEPIPPIGSKIHIEIIRDDIKEKLSFTSTGIFFVKEVEFYYGEPFGFPTVRIIVVP